MDLKDLSQKIESELTKLFEELRSGISAREDSRAFGAMIEHRINQVWEEVEWDRDINRFYDFFSDRAIQHYQRVGRDAQRRLEAIQASRQAGYVHFQFTR